MDLFVFGTLRAPDLMQDVAGGKLPRAISASLSDFTVQRVEGDDVPVLVPATGGRAQGTLYCGLDEDQAQRLDLYEGAFDYARQPVTVQTEGGSRIVDCYFGGASVAASGEGWSLTAWQEVHLRPAILAAQEVFERDPHPSMAELAARWKMIEARAWARYRAAPRSLTHSYQAKPGDVTVNPIGQPAGEFFKFQQFDVAHSRFDDARATGLKREAFFGVDAVILLPYDPETDRVLFVEQMRLGPALRHDPNPWMLEAVAGIIDARETPEIAARREGLEEAELQDLELRPAGNYYPSPGATTDFFYSFIGLCTLPEPSTYFGGLAEENEDLRLHVLPFKEAIAMMDNGEIATGPAQHLLLWLLRFRDDLRAAKP